MLDVRKCAIDFTRMREGVRKQLEEMQKYRVFEVALRQEDLESYITRRVSHLPDDMRQEVADVLLKCATVIDAAREEIKKREIEGAGYLMYPAKVYDCDPETLTWLVGDSKWKNYSSSIGSYLREIKWLFGIDESGPWAVRVPSTCQTVKEAFDWLKPAAVKQAEEEGRWVARQGDVYLVELKTSKVNIDDLPESHRYDAETRTFYHDGHAPVVVPEHVKGVRAFAQSQISSYGRRLYAD
ncbi:MAG: hypothetical protein K6U74_18925 [Firmicutes bacterium]|nr:hypothetical protein [Bacillota bacterium]